MAVIDWFRSLWKPRERRAPPGFVAVVPPTALVPSTPAQTPRPAQPAAPRATGPDPGPPLRLTLRDLLRRSGPWSEAEGVAFAVALIDAVLPEVEPFRLSLVTLEKLFFTPEGRVSAMADGDVDFGCMPPETLLGRKTDERSDVFLVGLFLYATLAGGPAVARGESDFATLTAMRNVDLVPLPSAPSAALQAVLARCLAPSLEDRFDSLGALREALAGLPVDRPRLLRRIAAGFDDRSRPPVPQPRTTPDDAEGQLLARLRAGEDDAREVLADLLESRGRSVEASWLRLELRVRRTRGEDQAAALRELRTVKPSREFIASVARPALEGCAVAFGFRCPKTWDALGLTADPLIRWCPSCEERVYFAADLDSAEDLSRAGRCVAVADHAVRGDGSPDRSVFVGWDPVRVSGRKR